MEGMSIEKIKEKASIIMSNSNLNVLNDEKEIIQLLNNIITDVDENIDQLLTNKMLENIDSYIKYKQKMLLAKEEYSYFRYCSKELKEQVIRKTDGIVYIPLFKITSNDNRQEKYFLIRNNAKEYINLHKEYYNETIEIEEKDIVDLMKIIDIIKGNY